MRLGKDTGSFTNYMLAHSKADLPKVGDGATVLA